MADAGGVLRLEPREQLLLLSIALEDLPEDDRAFVEPIVMAAMVVVRQMSGSATITEARYAIARARRVIDERRAKLEEVRCA
jgi:hypothetical protein